MEIHGFCSWRPLPAVAHTVASVPYDTVDRAEAVALAEGNPLSFLHVVRPEIGLAPSVDVHDPQVYTAGRAAMERLLASGNMILDRDRALYLYRLQIGTHVQRGIVACCNAEDYRNGLILRHEKTLQDKEDDRTCHIKTVGAHTGPVYLAYRDEQSIDALVATVEVGPALYDFTADDGVVHTVWKIADTAACIRAFAAVPRFYIADGHHRAAAAVRAAADLWRERSGSVADEAARFPCILFPVSQLEVLGNHRLVVDLGGRTPRAFLDAVRLVFAVEPCAAAFDPREPGQAGMYVDGSWYRISWAVPTGGDPVAALDVSVLQSRLLHPLLGIVDPRTSDRIAFVSGSRGVSALEEEVDQGRAAVAFAMCPVGVEGVIKIAASGREMPPKSTWFAPKPRSGLLVHPFEQEEGLLVEDLRISFGGCEVVHGVSFGIGAQETVALVGESGCGKSVTALALARLLPPAPACRVQGEIRIGGADVMAMTDAQLRRMRRAGIAYVFQDPAAALHPSLKIGYQLCEALDGRKATRRARALECLAMAGLRDPADLLQAYPFTLSGGMQQRVVIAMALAREPRLLVADEPTTALDVTIQAQILDLLVDLQKRLGMAMLLITHNLGLVASSADRVCVMYAGHIVESGEVEDVLRAPKHPYTRGLLDVVPRMEGALRRMEGIPGMVPSGGDLLPGCAFAPRCRFATDLCRAERPELVHTDAQRKQWVACHYPLGSVKSFVKRHEIEEII